MKAESGTTVLIACPPVGNPYVDLLADTLRTSQNVDVVACDIDAFWNQTGEWNIVHIQWPEALFQWQPPSAEEIASLEERLSYWKGKAKLVVTVHNLYPHYRNTELWRRVYQLIYTYADGIIHLGEASKGLLLDQYSYLSLKTQTIIPLGIYSNYPQSVTKTEARKRFGFSDNVFVISFIGQLRHFEETQLLLEGFLRCPVRRKHLIVAGQIAFPSDRLTRWLCYLRYRFRTEISFRLGFVPENEVQYYIMPADLLVIPRVNILNSSGVPFGFTFGKAVLGPTVGVAGEILQNTGNPVFDPTIPDSFTTALALARSADLEMLGRQNQEYANLNWSWSSVAQQHLDFYQAIRRPERTHMRAE